MFDTSIQTAIINSIVGNAVLGAIFLYLWRVDRHERALGIWGAAYATSACRVVFRLAGMFGYPEAIYGEALFGSASVVLLWLGTREFVGAMPRNPWPIGLAALIGFGSISGLAAAGIIPPVVPYLIAGMVFFLAGAALLRRGRDNPGVGYGLVGILFALYGGYVFVFSELASKPDDPRAYVFGPIINLAIGMLLLVVAQRRQQFAAVRLNEALQREAADRRAAEADSMESEQRFRAILDSTRSLVGLLSPDGTVLEINRAALERAGMERSAVIGKLIWEMPWWTHDAEQQQRLKAAIRRVAAGGYDRFESTHPAPDGGIGYFNFFLTPIRDASGKVAYLVPEGHDITARKRVEQTLHEAEQRFRAISEGSMIGVFATEPAGQITYLTRRATEITGVSEEDAVAGRWPEFTHPDDLAQQRAQWRRAMAERKPFVGERRYIRREGGIVWTRVHVAPIVDGDELRGFVGTIEDITAYKQIVQALRDSEEKFSSFFALTPEPIAVCLYPGGEYTEVNEAWCQVFGFRSAEVIGRTGLDLGLWERAEDRRSFYDDLSRSGEIRNAEIRFRRRGGQPINTLASAKVIRYGENQRILWNVHDLTAQRLLEDQRREAERALRASEERLSHVFYLLPDLVTISSIDEGRFVDMNHQWEAMMGYTREEALGTPTSQLGIWVDPEQRRRLVADVLRDGMVRSREISIRHKDGRQMICETSGTTFELHGKPLLLLVTRDITIQRQLEMDRAAAEQSLREREEQFSKFFALSPEPLMVVRYDDACCIDVNQAWLNKFGYDRDDVIGHTPHEFDFWVDFEERRKVIAALGANGEIQTAEVWFRAKDGSLVLAEVSAKLFELSRIRHVLWDVHDITDKRRSEDALRLSQEKFSKAFHGSPDYITISRLSDGNIIEANEAFERFTGYSREEAIGRTSLELGIWVYPREREEFARILGESGTLQHFECVLEDRNGRQHNAQITASAIEIDGQSCAIAIVRDVTEQLRMERELRKGEEKFSAIFHYSPVALGVTTIPEGQYLDVNEAWTLQFGYPRESLIGRTSRDIGLWVDVDERTRLFDDLSRKPEVRNREVHFRRGDGVEILCELSGHVFDLFNQPVLLWSAHDVTEHRRVQLDIRDLNIQLEARVRERTVRLQTANEELASALDALRQAQGELVRAEKLAALGSLVAGVAHELNTPIGNSVTVASTLFAKTEDFSREIESGRVKRSSLGGYLGGVRTATELLMRSLTQANELVSSFKQVAVDQASAQRRRFVLRLVIEEVMTTLAPTLKKTPFKFELDVADNLVMDGFPGPLGQVITNLVTNSLAHGFEGRKQGSIRLAARRLGADNIELVFSDDGVGIPEADLKHIFDPFFTTKLGRGGSGLGLHIVYNIVTRILGGKIRARSLDGGGASFMLILPVAAPETGGQESFA